ncbi:hypothetical protein [Enterobacter sp. Bisph1]|uniref:hypothetical protein n=1 Tax=Enterobacter sp. Bisph1 TaxID=1274399 RepID=UPI00057C1D00|nr:hypothetical protein [Enterobacter sp. Bisph1]
MSFKPKINPRKYGISAALEMKGATRNLSNKSVNKILQILYDDLVDCSNLNYDSETLNYDLDPSRRITRHFVTRLIQLAGERDMHRRLIEEELDYLLSDGLTDDNLIKITGFDTCRILIVRMFAKSLFVLELSKAKKLLEESPFLHSDPRRQEIKNFILRTELKAQQQKEQAIHRTMDKFHQLRLIRTPNLWTMTELVNDIIKEQFFDKKTKVRLAMQGLSLKRVVNDFHSLSTDILKTKIDEVLNDETGFDSLFKEMEFLDKLMDLSRDDEKNYPVGKYIVLYYTGKGDELTWWTKEECEKNNYPPLNPLGREIPNEETYRLEANKLRATFTS